MAITTINWDIYKQNLVVSKENKYKHGEILTPFNLIERIISLIPEKHFRDPTLKWLDIGAGSGFFSMILFKKLNIFLTDSIPNETIRHTHILENMIHMAELRDENINILRNKFGLKANIYHGDFLSIKVLQSFDFIIGNPPYNRQGQQKVPTNTQLNKRQDGKSIWFEFIKKSISMLVPGGGLCVIIPSLWLKPDKAKAYNFLTAFNIKKMHCINNTETNRLFKGNAQTPTCYFLLKKEVSDGYISLFDMDKQEYVSYPLRENIPIPLFAQSIIIKLIPFIETAGCIRVIKSNSISKDTKITCEACRHEPTKAYPYRNIHTCTLNKRKAKLDIRCSDKPCAFYKKPKLVLAHKMYGFPYLDKSGMYGISSRDNYIIMERSQEDLERLQMFLSTKTVIYLFEATRYRMKYLEKYIFELIPDITKLEDFPKDINDESIAKYFNFTKEDQMSIKAFNKRSYESFIKLIQKEVDK